MTQVEEVLAKGRVHYSERNPVRILVYPHDLKVGGSQINAIEIAARIQAAGHRMWIYGRRGPLVDRIEQLGLEFIESPDPRRRPSKAVVKNLREVIAACGIDVVHGYEWPPALEAAIATGGRGRAVGVGTVMSMAVAPFLPRTLPLTVGTEQIVAAERAAGRARTELLEPPVDLSVTDVETARQAIEFRRSWALDTGAIVVVCVTRLAHQLKLEGLLSAIESVGEIAPRRPMRLVIVGDGPAAQQIRDRAAAVNRGTGSQTIILTGELIDPGPAYAAADVCIGMGGSALRSMAWAKPLIVQGEKGFFRLLAADSLPQFLWQGWYGTGTNAAAGSQLLSEILLELTDDPSSGRLRELGQFGRAVIEERFSLEIAAARLTAFYERAITQRTDDLYLTADAVRSAALFAWYHVKRRVDRRLGKGASDDFNSRPVAGSGFAPLGRLEPADGSTARLRSSGGLIYFSGAPWDAIPGTDRNLATSLGRHRAVLWVDPPMSWLACRRRKIDVPTLTDVAPGVRRIHIVVPPGVGRPGMRVFARWWTDRVVRRAIKAERLTATSMIASSPEPVLSGWRRSQLFRVYYATDDFVAGAELLGFSRAYMKKSRRRNVNASDLTMAVSQNLVDCLSIDHPRSLFMPNGCNAELYLGLKQVRPAPEISLPGPIAGVIGQLNDRLDVAMLEAVANRGESLLLVGPRYEERGATLSRLDELIGRSNVQWVGRQPLERMPEFMAAIDVGLTPYSDNPFNRASFPLKTLEYLVAGKPVVSTDLPSTRALGTDLIELVSSPAEFARAVSELLHSPQAFDRDRARRRFGEQNSWSNRAAQVDALIR